MPRRRGYKQDEIDADTNNIKRKSDVFSELGKRFENSAYQAYKSSIIYTGGGQVESKMRKGLNSYYSELSAEYKSIISWTKSFISDFEGLEEAIASGNITSGEAATYKKVYDLIMGNDPDIKIEWKGSNPYSNDNKNRNHHLMTDNANIQFQDQARKVKSVWLGAGESLGKSVELVLNLDDLIKAGFCALSNGSTTPLKNAWKRAGSSRTSEYLDKVASGAELDKIRGYESYRTAGNIAGDVALAYFGAKTAGTVLSNSTKSAFKRSDDLVETLNNPILTQKHIEHIGSGIDNAGRFYQSSGHTYAETGNVGSALSSGATSVAINSLYKNTPKDVSTKIIEETIENKKTQDAVKQLTKDLNLNAQFDVKEGLDEKMEEYYSEK